MIASAFTCTGPYAVLIMLGIKRVENRSVMPAPAEDAARLFHAAVPITGRMEGFFVLPLDDVGCAISAPVLVSLGHENGTTAVDPREVFGEALKAGARSIVVAHNHPSGDLTPSRADIAMTAKLREAGNMLGVSLLDHLILGSDSKFAIVNSAKG